MKHIEAELAEVKKEIVKVSLLGGPGSILLGLGIYGAFAANGNAFHPFLNSIENAYGMIALGGAITIWEVVKIVQLSKKKQGLTRQLNADA